MSSHHMMHMAQVENLASAKDATHVATKSGAWSDPSTWEDGKVPDANARVHIPEQYTVTYDEADAVPLDTVRVDGTLKWSQDKDTEMLVTTIVTSHGSTIEVGSMDDPMPSDIEATITFRDVPLNKNADPEQLSNGLVAFGHVDIQGAKKESYVTLENGAKAGTNSVKVDGSLRNWEVGDTLLFVGTGSGSRDETRTITSIEGDTITFDKALSYNHQPPAGHDFETYVGNLSRNVTFRSEDPDGVRGHIMMHNGTPDPDDGSINCVRYAAFEDLGRTDNGRVTGTNDNPIGRYPLHLHEIGTEPGAPTSMIEGNAVWGSKGWGIVQHSSHAMVNDNIVFETRGAGIVSEDGDETGMWMRNLVTSVSDHSNSISGHDQVGAAGAAYENQSRVIIQQDNIAANAGIGWNFFALEHFPVSAIFRCGRIIRIFRKMFEREQVPFDPSPFDVALDHEEPPIIDFNGN
ncbi:MAG: G8 domain-containing protein, partial [Pseudomonadota bacterium]